MVLVGLIVMVVVLIGLVIFFSKWAKVEKERKEKKYKEIKNALDRREYQRVNTAGETLLMQAIREGFEDLVKELLEISYGIHRENQKGETALFYAVQFGNFETMNQLIRKGAAVNHKNKVGETPLWYASMKSDPKFAKALIEKGALLDDSDEQFGMTPLMVAAKNGHYTLVEDYIKAGADPTIQSPEGTAGDIAEKYMGQTFSIHGEIGFQRKEMIRRLRAAENNKPFVPKDYREEQKRRQQNRPD